MILSVMRELRAVKAPAAVKVSLCLCDLVRGVAESGLNVVDLQDKSKLCFYHNTPTNIIIILYVCFTPAPHYL